MASRSAVVILGSKKPLPVLDTSNIAEGCGSKPVSLMPMPWAKKDSERKKRIITVTSVFMVAIFNVDFMAIKYLIIVLEINFTFKDYC
jgi:hypothetical protein